MLADRDYFSYICGQKIVTMTQKVLDQISLQIHIYTDAWANGKTGAISDERCEGVFRFFETRNVVEEKNGQKYVVEKCLVHENIEENPIVAIGIVACWLSFRNNPNRFASLTVKKTWSHKCIKELFDKYTQMRYDRFRDMHKDNPETWKWDWDYEFYAKYIVPNELKLNDMTKALLAFLPEEEQKEVRAVMDNYIEYLIKIREDKGYYVCNELKILRYLDTQDLNFLETINVEDWKEALGWLERTRCIKVAWVEGHTPEEVRMLDRGRIYLKCLEDQVHLDIDSKEMNMAPKEMSVQIDSGNLAETFAEYVVKLREIVELHALPEIKHKYEWLAVWRAMYDMDLLSKKDYKAFATMINNWFPEAKVSCSADAMGDYSAPYLGETNHEQWNENDFINLRSSKQSLDGYKSLKRICELLHSQLNAFLNKKTK